MPAASMDRLYLVNASGLPQFRPVYDALSRMGFYNLNPDEIRELQSPDPGDLLAPDGSNIASVLAQMQTHRPEVKRRIEEYLAKVVPGISGVTSKIVGPKETLEFRQKVAGDDAPWKFLAASMSDGTLRTLGVLVSLFQSSNGSTTAVPLVGIEEPEAALHPGAAGEASRIRQVLVTSHSPDLLDDDLEPESILTVDAKDGVTQIGPMDDAGRSALRERLYTPGELLRAGQLNPSSESCSIPDAEEDSDQRRLVF